MFSELFEKYNWSEISEDILNKKSSDVELLLKRKESSPNTECNIEDFKTLISPAATPFLERMAQLSRNLTLKRFGKTMQMYIPLYLSNECQNICTYCGFSLDNKIKRITLNKTQLLTEVETIKSYGYDHVLLVTGEAQQTVGLDYFIKCIRIIRPYFSHISMEVQPLSAEEYKTLSDEGVNTILVYQETYHREKYKEFHPKGKKSNFDYRLETPDRIGNSGIHKIGLGVLLGLEDWRTDSFFCALHLKYLEKQYWETKFSISFPRLRPIHLALAHEKQFHSTMSDRDLLQLICAYRIFDEEVELSLSTRESPRFRDHVFKLGITSMSAGSKTNPGGYSAEPDSLEQFEISDERSAKEIAEMLHHSGYTAVWKDWDEVLCPAKRSEEGLGVRLFRV